MPPHPPDPLCGPLLTRLRRARGWSQSRLAAELCAAAGVPTLSRHEISRWERQRRTPGRFWHAWLATVLGMPTNPSLDPPTAAPEATDAGADVPPRPGQASRATGGPDSPPADPPIAARGRPATGPTVATGGDGAHPAGDRDRRVDRCRPASARPPAHAVGRAATRRNVGGSARRDLTH
ncbi:helix-turn-helix domain-containing protein [Micromonospora sp. NPDC051196]|uniref:helix-turn-helix domain-containing protein n=1 Tax=Micromonospora sp. NPDC051196 TaxID=3155281 RepID=UPI003426C52A